MTPLVYMPQRTGFLPGLQKDLTVHPFVVEKQHVPKMGARHKETVPGTCSRDRLLLAAQPLTPPNLIVARNEPTLARKNGLSAYNQYSIEYKKGYILNRFLVLLHIILITFLV
jgi:hypothetical protein